MAQSFLKAPTETLDYSIDWSDWLDDDAISTSSWSADTGITVATDPAASNTATIATVWLSGGTAGQNYKVINTIVTSGERTAIRYIEIRVRNR
jgi:hypothetical protein